MNCKVHPERGGINTCSKCGEWLCAECSVEVNGRIVCKNCISKLVGPPSGYGGYRVEKPARRHISWGLLFVFSCCMPPGVNYMYMGLIKRGLFMISAFFLSIFFALSLGVEPLLGAVLPIMWITGIFDGFHMRRKLNAGEYVEDSVRDIISFFKRYKWIVLAVLLFFMTTGWGHGFRYSYHGEFSGLSWMISRFMSLIPTLIILFGVLSIFKSTRSSGKRVSTKRDDEYDDSNVQ